VLIIDLRDYRAMNRLLEHKRTSHIYTNHSFIHFVFHFVPHDYQRVFPRVLRALRDSRVPRVSRVLQTQRRSQPHDGLGSARGALGFSDTCLCDADLLFGGALRQGDLA